MLIILKSIRVETGLEYGSLKKKEFVDHEGSLQQMV